MDPSLYEAASSGDVGFLIGGHVSIHDVLNQKTPKHNNILHIAAEFKQTNFFDDLRLGDRLSPLFWAQNKKGNTPLHIAARVGCHEVVKFLINSIARCCSCNARSLRTTNLEADTALHVAARCGHDGVVSLLMEADPQLCCLTNSAKESPLFVAIRQGFLLIARSILNNCPISPSFEGINGVTALHAVVTHNNDDEVAEGKQSAGMDKIRALTLKIGIVKSKVIPHEVRHCQMLDIVKIMVDKYPETIKRVDALGWTPLHYAALRGNLDAIKLLMQGDTSASYIPDESGMSALHVAAYAGRTQVIKEIIQRLPDTCDLLNHKGQTVLHAAVLGERKNVVKYILETPKLAGLINEADEDGNTPFHLAAIYQKDEIIRYLAGDEKVNTIAINKEFLKAIDIFRGDIGEHINPPEDPTINLQGVRSFYKRINVLRRLKRSVSVPFFQQKIKRDFWKLQSPAEKDTASGTPAIADQNANPDRFLPGGETRLLVATLIATVTFAAAFTQVPGGTDSNDGRPVLRKSSFFFMFMLANTFSFTLSFTLIFMELLVTHPLQVPLVASLLNYSFGGMFLAFYFGGVAIIRGKAEVHVSHLDFFIQFIPTMLSVCVIALIISAIRGGNLERKKRFRERVI